MYTGVLHLHSYWAYLVLGVLLIAVINSIAGLAGKKEFVVKDFRLALFSLIVTHIQLLIGLILWFISPNGLKVIINNGMAEAMGENFRFNVVEHPLMMIIAVVLVTMGYSRHKKKIESSAKFKTIVIFYILTLVVILSRLPWDQWL